MQRIHIIMEHNLYRRSRRIVHLRAQGAIHIHIYDCYFTNHYITSERYLYANICAVIGSDFRRAKQMRRLEIEMQGGEKCQRAYSAWH